MEININNEWHQNNKIRKNAKIGRVIVWYLEHFRHCGCSAEIPDSLKEVMEKHYIKIPVPPEIANRQNQC